MSTDVAHDLAEAKAITADAYKKSSGELRKQLAKQHQLYGHALEEIEMMRACIRKLCPEVEARHMLTFAAAEAIFSQPRRDQQEKAREMSMQAKYPVGGPREPVYVLMRGLGFSGSNWSDKHWESADGIKVQIFGAGSMARISLAGEPKGECELDQLSERIDALRQPPT